MSDDVRTNAELTEVTASGLRWITLVRIGMEILLLGAMVLLARLIPPAQFGMFAVVLIFQELAISVPSEGVGSAIVQRRNITREHLQGGLAMSLLAGTSLAALTLLLALLVVDPLFGRETASLVVLAAPLFLLGAGLALPLAVLRRRLDFRRLSLVDLAQTVVRAVVSIALAIIGLDASALVLGGVAGITAALALALFFAPVPLPRWRGGAIRDLLAYGGPAALACVAWTGFRNGDYAIVGARLGANAAGFYWRGFQLAVEYQRKVSVVMAQVAFPVLARTTGAEAMFALRRRMVQLLTVTLFPLLVSLVVLAPVVVPWVFGPAWEPAVLPTQILAGAGAATVVIDAVGSVLMAAGRARALLGFGVAHFAVYVVAVLFASNAGLAGVATAASVVHGVFLFVAYRVMLEGQGQSAVRLLWADLSAATVSCLALLAVAGPVEWALREAGASAPIHVLAVGVAGGLAYLLALRSWFDDAWRDLSALLRRLLPDRLVTALRRVPPAARPPEPTQARTAEER